MAKAVAKRPKRRTTRRQAPEWELFIFEIESWEPSYHLSVNSVKDREGPYNEIVLVEVRGICRHPEKVFGRRANFSLYAQRNMMEPPEFKFDRHWRPNSIGYVQLPPTNGHGYARLPHDSLAALITALAHGHFRYLTLHGPPLNRGRSSFRSMGFSNDEGLDDEGGVRPPDLGSE